MIAKLSGAIGCIAIALLGGTASVAAEPVTVATPSRVIFALPYWIAERNGYFKDEGIEPTLKVGGQTGPITAQLRAGQIQVHIGGPNGVLLDADKGGPLRIIAGVVRRPPLWLIAKPSIKSFADLRGATIGALSLTEGSSKLLLRMTQAEGLKLDDFKLIAIGGAPARHHLLQEGKIDAGMQPLPLNYQEQELGFTDLGWAGKYEPDWQFITVNASAEWLRAKPKIAAGFVRALLRAQQDLAANPQGAAQIAADVLGTPLPLAARALSEALKLGILDPRLDVSEPGLRKIYETIQSDGRIPRDTAFDAGKVLALQDLKQAQQELAAKAR